RRSRAFGNGPGVRRRPPAAGQPQPKPEKVTDRAQDRNEARPGPNAGDPRIMPHRHLRDPKPAALALEVQLGVQQGGPRQQRRRGLKHPAAHQLETAIQIANANAVHDANQHIEDPRDHQPIARVGPALPQAALTIWQAGASGARVWTERPRTLPMFAASLCAGMTRVSEPSSMGQGYENATRSVMKAVPHEKTMRLETSRRLRLQTAGALPFVLALIAAVAYASISIYRHDAFASNAFDLGVQDQTVWGYSQLQMIPNTVEMIRNLLGDHFHAILMTLAPLYLICNDG